MPRSAGEWWSALLGASPALPPGLLVLRGPVHSRFKRSMGIGERGSVYQQQLSAGAGGPLSRCGLLFARREAASGSSSLSSTSTTSLAVAGFSRLGPGGECFWTVLVRLAGPPGGTGTGHGGSIWGTITDSLFVASGLSLFSNRTLGLS